MTAPTLKLVKTADGFIWEIAFAGMVFKQHSQSWQALIFYHQAMECYNRDGAGNLKALLHNPDSTQH